MEKTSQIFLKRLDLYCFRNYSYLHFSPSSQSLIVFNPESLNLLKGPAENRRWWLDHWLGLQEKKSFSRDFKKVLLQKNQLLKQIKKGFVSKKKA